MLGHGKKRKFGQNRRFSAASLALITGLGIAGSVYAYKEALAAMAVTDAGAIAKLASQLSELTKMVESLSSIKTDASGMLDTIGEAGAVEFGNISAVQRQVRQWSGVLNDPSSLKVDFNLPKGVALPDFTDVLRTNDFYSEVLLYNPPEKPKKVDGVEVPPIVTTQQADLIEYRRFKKTEDSAVTGMSVADTAIADFSRVMSEVENLQSEADNAEDDVARQSVIMNLLVKINQQLATSNLIEASALAVVSGGTLKDMPSYLHTGKHQTAVR